jgi:tRNA-specific 2-thiouridylase
MRSNKRVLLAASGGIDSSMCAKKLQDSGYEVTAMYAKMHGFEDVHNHNIENLKKICDYLAIDLIIIDLQEIFSQTVIEPFARAYIDGLTPNPCATCNQNIKFGALFDIAMGRGFDYFATGHYAKTDGKFIYEARDTKKDQSYFLYGINPNIIPKLIFPLGDTIKEELKQEAMQIPTFANLAKQKESTEICFVKNNYIEILRQVGAKVENSGDVLDMDGKIIGKHKGYLQYTIGQRKGFDAPLLQTPHYVVNVNPAKNQIYVAEREFLSGTRFELVNCNWFEKPQVALVKVRYLAHKIRCVINGNNVVLGEPAFAITKGQVAVFYDNERMFGGGIINI